MVYYFLTQVASPSMVIYMGEDKFENEELLKWGFPEDVWFHVDDLSSAHVYLRLPKGMCVEDIPKDVLTDCAQLVKANSIQGCKMSSVTVVYTAFSNLKKTGSMDVGQVGFHNQKKVYRIVVDKKNNDILKRLEKTKEQRRPDFRAEREERDRQERQEQRRREKEEREREKLEARRKKEEEEIRSYASVMKEENMISNKVEGEVDYKAIEDDFM